MNRNDPCRCGSRRKYKRCCWVKDEVVLTRAANEEALMAAMKRISSRSGRAAVERLKRLLGDV